MLHGFFRVTSVVVTSVKHAMPLTSKKQKSRQEKSSNFLYVMLISCFKEGESLSELND